MWARSPAGSTLLSLVWSPQPQHSEGTQGPQTRGSSSAALSLALRAARQALSSPRDPFVAPMAEEIEPLD